MKKILATIVIILLVVALGFSIFFAATHYNQSDPNQTQSTKKKDKKETTSESHTVQSNETNRLVSLD